MRRTTSREPAARAFDARLGPAFLATVPTDPGVYRWLDADGVIIYVGKAKSLRRRLAQYRHARPRSKRHAKARLIVRDAASVAFDIFPSELAAALEEVRLIQALRPRHNVASAFAFLYPLLGVARHADHARLCVTTHPELLPGYAFHGVFRSRALTRSAFFALTRLLRYVAHPVPRRQLGAEAHVTHSYVSAWRRLAPRWVDAIEAFWRGADPALLGDLALALLDRAGARARADEVQADLRLLRVFFKEEVLPLRAAVDALAFPTWPVPQAARDPLFLRYRSAT